MQTPDANDAFLISPGQGQALWFLANRMSIKATAETTHGGFGLIESTVAPGFSPPLHVHHREDESFWVLEGEVTMRCGERTFHAGPGSFIFLPRGVPHTFVVESDTPARWLTLITPGGGEGFFRKAGRPAEAEGLPPAAPPEIERLQRFNEEFGAEIVGPPMTRDASRQ